MERETMIQINLEISKEDLKEEQESMQQNGITIQKTEIITKPPPRLGEALFVQPISAILITTIPILAKWIVGRFLNKGTLIDLKEDPPKVSRIAGIPQGNIVIIDRNGNSHLYRGDSKRLEDVTSDITKMLSSFIERI